MRIGMRKYFVIFNFTINIKSNQYLLSIDENENGKVCTPLGLETMITLCVRVCRGQGHGVWGKEETNYRNFNILPKSALASGLVVGFLTGFGIENRITEYYVTF